MKKIILAVSLLTLFSLVLVPFLANAQEETTGWPPTAPNVNMDNPTELVTTILNWFFGIVIIVAAIMIISAGFTYVTSAGNADKIKGAMNTIIYALVGIAVALLAKGLVFMVCKFISGAECKFF
ncbi:MAG: TrbC/VirB2 family protein [Candidatus Paceibacterota bacterium]|jgi:low temperature requirement protein LtrA